MGWFAVDDHFPTHRKVRELQAFSHDYTHALALWVLSGAWCCAQERERFTGFVPTAVLATFGIGKWKAAADALVSVGLWEYIEFGGHRVGIAFHDWTEWNGINGREYRSKEQTRLRVQAYRLRECRAGRHSKDCPPATCPKKIARDTKRAAKESDNPRSESGVTARNVTPGRDGSSKSSHSVGADTDQRAKEENTADDATNDDNVRPLHRRGGESS